jgi:DNA-binding SARP family transcriptional activator
MAVRMEFGLLGPLTVRSDGMIVPIPKGKQRALLAALVLHASRTVSADELADLLWDSAPPPSAPITLQNYVKRLRQGLGAAGRERIRTEPGGYRIQVEAGELDITIMEEELATARRAARLEAWPAVSEHAAVALACWRGEPFSDVVLPGLARHEVPRLEELRSQARELRIEADFHLARYQEVITDLRRLTLTTPLREHLHALLMRALYRCGRRADALEAYQKARRVLVQELGSEPSLELKALHRQILEDDPELLRPSTRPAAPPDFPIPKQLSAAPSSFTGRDAELSALASLLIDVRAHAPAVLITAIAGSAGVGKTALAVQWAHQVAERFPDGQLYANLRGYDPEQPIPAEDALAGFLRALGMMPADIPVGLDERAAAYRTLLAGRAMLVILDNACDSDQVRPLLPGTPGCLTLVTSRDALPGLVARDGARRLDLDVFPLADAINLLRALIGARVDAEPEAAAALAAPCCRLPLALRVAAELAAARPAASLASLTAELADQQRRLDLLEAGGDTRTAVRAVFSWSSRQLDPDMARAFRLIGLFPGPDLDAYAIAALTGGSLTRSREILTRLARAHLVQPVGPGRHGMHDLLRDYARELAAADDTEHERAAAMTRLLDYYVHTAAAAATTMFPAGKRRPPATPAPKTPVPPVADPAAARAWLDAELVSLVSAAACAADGAWPSHACELAGALWRYLDSGGHYPEATALHAYAAHAAARSGNPVAEAEASVNLAIAEARQCSYQDATGHLRRALALYRTAGDRLGEARALGNLGATYLRQGNYQQASAYLELALPMFREAGSRSAEASALNNLGLADLRLGKYRQAADYLQKSLALGRELGSRASEARVLTNLGEADLRRGHYAEAASYFDQSLGLCRDTGDRVGEAYALAGLGEVGHRSANYEQAVTYLDLSLALFREMGDRAGETEACIGLGAISLGTGQAEIAQQQYANALALAKQSGDMYLQATALAGIGDSYAAAGGVGPAIDSWRRALALYENLGTPDADRMRAALAAPMASLR